MAEAHGARPDHQLGDLAGLAIRGLEVAYGDAVALRGVALDVAPGECVAVVGPNGAGKTTLIHAIAGLLRPRAGTLVFGGVELGRVRPHEVTGQGIALVPEGRRLFTALSVEENLLVGCYRPALRARRAEGLARVFTLFPVLGERRRQTAGTLSGGQQQMVAIGRALMAEPRLLLLDEPSLGLAPVVVDQLFTTLADIHAGGTALLLVEQNVPRALALAERACVLEEGRITATGAPRDLLADARIRHAYLGEPASPGARP